MMTDTSTSAKRWTRAQSAEANFWLEELKTSSHLDSSGRARARTLDLELSVFDLNAVRQLFAGADCVVEVGCGPIGVIHFISTPGRRVGLDPLMQQLEASGYTERHGVTRLAARGEDIPLRSESASVVICYNALDHAESPAKVLAEIKRILRPDGVLLLQLHAVRHIAAIFGPILSWLDPPHPFHFSKKQILGLVADAGLTVEYDGSVRRKARRFPFRELLSYDGIRHLGSNVITVELANLRLRKR
jgi:SAM-dependent methyltransferase